MTGILISAFALVFIFYLYKTIDNYIVHRNLFNENYYISIIFIFVLFQIGLHTVQIDHVEQFKAFNELILFYLMVDAGVTPILRYYLTKEKGEAYSRGSVFTTLTVGNSMFTWVWLIVSLLLMFLSFTVPKLENIYVWMNLLNFIYTVANISFSYYHMMRDDLLNLKFIVFSNILFLSFLIGVTELIDFFSVIGNNKLSSYYWYFLITPIVWSFGLRPKIYERKEK